MNWMLPAASSLAALLLVSCGHFGRKSANETIIYNPTVADLAKLETQWGVAPKAATTGTATSTSSTGASPSGSATHTTTTTTSTTTAPADTATPPIAPVVP